MDRTTLSISLQEQNAWPFEGCRIILDQDCSVDPSDDLLEENTVRRKLAGSVRRYFDLVASNKQLHTCECLAHQFS
jgi:hypothetical protein